MTAPQTPTETTEPTEDTTEATDVDTTPTDEPEPEPEAPESPNAEAAKWRTKLRAAEAERDQLREQLTAQQRAVIDWRSANSIGGAVDPQLLDAADINITDLLGEDGHLDMAAVDQFIDATATRFRVHRMVKPNPQQGNPSAAPAQPGLVGMFQQDQQTPGRR